MLAVWGTADIGLPQPGWRGATDRFPVNWTGGFDLKASFVTGRKARGPVPACSWQVAWHKLAARG